MQRPPQHQQRQQEQETAETAPAVHEDPETGADPREHSHTASGEAPPNHRQPSGSGTSPQTTQPEPQAEQSASTSHGGHSSAPSGDTQNNQQQRQERQHPPPAGYHHTAAASSSSETGTPSSAAQQWGRYTPGAGDQRTRNKADKTWIHAEFAKRGWKKPPHLTWRQVEHWLQGPEQRERGEQAAATSPPQAPPARALYPAAEPTPPAKEPPSGDFTTHRAQRPYSSLKYPGTPPAAAGDPRADSRPTARRSYIQTSHLGAAASRGTSAAPSPASSSSGDEAPA